MIEFNPDLPISLVGMTCSFAGGSHCESGKPVLVEPGLPTPPNLTVCDY